MAENGFQQVKVLVGTYLALGVATLVAIWLMRDDHAAVTDAVWTRATLVVAGAAVLYLFTHRAAQGSRRAYLRVRLVSAIMLVAIVVIVVLPGVFPVWMRVDQAVVGLVVLGIVTAVNSRNMRARFVAK